MVHELGSLVCIADGMPALKGQECRHPEYIDPEYQKRQRNLVNLLLQIPEFN